MLFGITHVVSPNIGDCALTFIDREPLDWRLSIQQHGAYSDLLRKCGVIVEELTGNEVSPDCCFVEDTAIVVDELAVITSMGTHLRRRETPLIKQALSRYRETIEIKLPALIDGGDVLRMGRNVFVGQSSRTNEEGADALRQALEPFGYKVTTVLVKNCLHLKTACSALDDQTLIVNKKWVETDHFKNFKQVATPDSEPWSANVLRIGETLCLASGFPRTLDLVSQEFGNIEILDISEFQKAEAGLTCLSLIFESSPTA